MAPSKLRSAIGAVKDQTSISLAKVGSSRIADLDVAILKATRHEEYPPDERHIREIITLTTYERAYVNACVNTIARRLNKTKNWVVALKTLMVIHRLLLEGDLAYEQEIFFATKRGTRLLNMSDFRDASGKSDAWDYSAFVRTYALYLDEQLELRMQVRRGKRGGSSYQADKEEDRSRTTPVREMKNERIFSKLHHHMQLLERFLACRPTGAAKLNRVVGVALYPIVKESFQVFYDINEIMGVLIERFMHLEIPAMVKVHEVFSRVSKQYDELDEFYCWCKTLGIANDYPDVEKIPQEKLDRMDEYIRQRSQNMSIGQSTPSQVPVVEEPEPEEEIVKSIEAAPIETHVDEQVVEIEKQQEEEDKPKEEVKRIQEVGDLLNLAQDALSIDENGDKLALALFDAATTTPGNSTPPWEAFNDSSGDWETSLVQSASHLANQKASLPGGFDTLLLDGMYQQGHAIASSSSIVATGSASSVALGSAGRPAMLALPAPPSADGGVLANANNDPFAASLAIAPPAYVQMSEMEKKQRMLVEEQIMWQQYARDGMQGQVGMKQQNQLHYNTGGYTKTY